MLLPALLSIATRAQESATFSCPAGKVDMMKYFVIGKSTRGQHYLTGSTNSVYTQVFPDEDSGLLVGSKAPRRTVSM